RRSQKRRRSDQQIATIEHHRLPQDVASRTRSVSAINRDEDSPGVTRMWKLILTGALAIAATSADAKPAVQQAPTSLQSPFHRGVNVLGYDPYWKDTSKRRFEWRHFTKIRRGGFDFVRLNLQAFRFMDAGNRLDPVWLAKLDDVVREAGKAGLGVIIDEHDFNPCSEDLDVCRTKLSAFWEQVAPRFAKAPRNVAFELLNEPHDKLNGEPW